MNLSARPALPGFLALLGGCAREQTGAIGVLVAAVLFLAGLAGATVGVRDAEAAFPGTNGPIACSGPLQEPNPVSRLEIFTMNDSGGIDAAGSPTSQVRLTTNFDSDFNPRYSADGRKIAFIRQTNDLPGGSVWTMDADGSNQRQLTFGAGGTTGYSDGFVGGFSPDGSKIVFQRSVAPAGAAPRNFEVFTINVDGTGETNISNNQAAANNSDSQPSWSPDGTTIAFQSNRAGNPDIWLMNANGGNPRNLTAGSTAEESAPDFSPNGQQIAFQSDRGFIPRPDANGGSGRNVEIHRMSAVDGSNVVRLTFNDYNPAATGGLTTNNLSGFDLNPHWSPEGDRIVFHSGRGIEFGAAQWDVFTINSATGENPTGGQPARRLTRRDANDERCGWGPLTHRLTVTRTGPGVGTVTSSVAGIDCGEDCTDIFKHNQQVTLTATPAAASRFMGFTGGGCSGTATTCTVTINQAQAVTATFALSAPPDTAITSGPSGTSASSTATFEFSSTEAGSSFECKLDAGEFAACTSPKVLTDLSNGQHTFSVRARDAAGNVDPTPATRTWTVNTTVPDTTPPDTAITSGPSGTSASSTATFEFFSTESGSSFECKLDGPGAATGSFVACSSPKDFSGLANGSYTFSVRAKDAAGNTDVTPANRTFTVATPPPDSDGDGVPNASDQCPTVAGPATRGGCPAPAAANPAPNPVPTVPATRAPSSVFSFSRRAQVKRRLTILTLRVPGLGVVKAAQAGTGKALIRAVRVTADAAGNVEVRIRPSRAGKRRLANKRSFTVRVKFTYTPSGGTSRSTSKRVKIKR